MTIRWRSWEVKTSRTMKRRRKTRQHHQLKPPMNGLLSKPKNLLIHRTTNRSSGVKRSQRKRKIKWRKMGHHSNSLLTLFPPRVHRLLMSGHRWIRLQYLLHQLMSTERPEVMMVPRSSLTEAMSPQRSRRKPTWLQATLTFFGQRREMTRALSEMHQVLPRRMSLQQLQLHLSR